MSSPPPRSLAAHATRTHDVSDAEITILTTASVAAKAHAYCPYSHFRVGAALLTRRHDLLPISGATSTTTTTAVHSAADAAHDSVPSARIITGANVENAAYPIGTCAERVALGSAVGGLGLRRGDFAALAVVADTAAGAPVTPCGMCRQALREFCEDDMPVFMGDGEGAFVVRLFSELLPMSFGPASLPESPACALVDASC